MSNSSSQRGLSFFGFIFVLVALGTIGLIAARAVPAHSEYFSVQRVLKDVLNEVGAGGSRTQYATAFDRRSQIDDISSVKGADIKVSSANGQTTLTIEYEKRQSLIGYASLLFDFKAEASK